MEAFIRNKLAVFDLDKHGEEPVNSMGTRILNIIRNNFRGIIGFFVPIFILPWFERKGEHHITVQCVWFWIFWCFLVQPVDISVAGFIPLFIFPLTGVMSTKDTCLAYFNEYVALYILGGWVSLLLNHSEFDRRVILWFLISKQRKDDKVKCLLVKASVAAYTLSMISNRLVVTSKIMQIVTVAFSNMQRPLSSDGVSQSNEMLFVIMNSIQSSSSIGGIGIVHSSYATLAFLAVWCSSEVGKVTDIFNYLQYSLYAIPTSLVMFSLNLAYHVLLIYKVDTKINADSLKLLWKSINKSRRSLSKKITLHEKLAIIFTSLSLLLYFSRWNKWFGWSHLQNKISIKDAVVAALFAIVTQIIPKDWKFLKYFSSTKKRQLPPQTSEISMVLWRYANDNTNYGHIYMLGCGLALYKAAKISGVGYSIMEHSGKVYSSQPWLASIFFICLSSLVLTNIMTGAAALAIFLPFVMLLDIEDLHLAALAVGIGCSLGLMCPFRYTPAYYCHRVGKVPVKIMVKYSIVSVLICLLVLWLSLCFWAPLVISSPWPPRNSTNI